MIWFLLADQGIEIFRLSDIQDVSPVTKSSPIIQYDLSESGRIAPKMNGSDGDSIFTALEKTTSEFAQQQRPPQNVLSLCGMSVVVFNSNLIIFMYRESMYSAILSHNYKYYYNFQIPSIFLKSLICTINQIMSGWVILSVQFAELSMNSH